MSGDVELRPDFWAFVGLVKKVSADKNGIFAGTGAMLGAGPTGPVQIPLMDTAGRLQFDFSLNALVYLRSWSLAEIVE